MKQLSFAIIHSLPSPLLFLFSFLRPSSPLPLLLLLPLPLPLLHPLPLPMSYHRVGKRCPGRAPPRPPQSYIPQAGGGMISIQGITVQRKVLRDEECSDRSRK
jgi:hypothetical protein